MKNLYRVYLLLTASLLFALMACTPPTATPTITPTQSATPTWTPMPSATPTLTPTPTITPTPGPPAAEEVFALVSPSVAFIETERGFGSGILIADGYLVTNAHVTWPFSTVRVIFPDGTEFADAPVVNIDPLADLALIGPLDTDIAPVALVDGEDQAVGSDVYLIGYPGEPEKSPQPTLTRGLISRTREWDTLGITYFQTDALIAGGQSGGAFVSDYGNVIGISGLSFSEAKFGLVASAADLLPRIEDLVNTSASENRNIPVNGGKRGYDDVLLSAWDTKVYVIQEKVGSEIDIEVESDDDVSFEVVDMYGHSQLWVDELYSGKATGSFTIETPGPHFLVVEQRTQKPINFHVEGSRVLIPFPDIDDHTPVKPNETVSGYLDYPGDSDQFRINLDQGEQVNIRVDTTLFDPVLAVEFLGAGDEQIIVDDDSGEGMFGLSAELTYKAPHNGVYNIIVKNARDAATGGYMLQVENYSRSIHPTPMVPAPTRVPVMITLADLPSEFDEMMSQDLKKLTEEMSFAADGPFGFENRYKFQIIFGFTTSLSDPIDSAAFDFLLDHPELMAEMFSNFTDDDSSGADVEAVAITDLGDQAIKITMVYRMEGISIRYEIIMFRQGDVGAFLFMGYLNGYPPEVQLIELAHLLDMRLLNQ